MMQDEFTDEEMGIIRETLEGVHFRTGGRNSRCGHSIFWNHPGFVPQKGRSREID